MGLIGSLLGTPTAVQTLGATAKGIAEVFVPNATRKMELAGEAYGTAMGQYSEEFAQPGDGLFDRFVNGLNRLPRPMLALGTLGLFTYAMAEPSGFSIRMQGLAYVPEPLWWLLGAIVSFYFGAREAHYFRTGSAAVLPAPASPASNSPATNPPESNPALDDWRRS